MNQARDVAPRRERVLPFTRLSRYIVISKSEASEVAILAVQYNVCQR